MAHSSKNKSGFTLVEILIIILVFGMLSTMAISTYMKSTDTFKFLSEFKNTMSSLRTARSYALTNREEQPSAGAARVPDRYGIAIWPTQVVVFADLGDVPFSFVDHPVGFEVNGVGIEGVGADAEVAGDGAGAGVGATNLGLGGQQIIQSLNTPSKQGIQSIQSGLFTQLNKIQSQNLLKSAPTPLNSLGGTGTLKTKTPDAGTTDRSIDSGGTKSVQPAPGSGLLRPLFLHLPVSFAFNLGADVNYDVIIKEYDFSGTNFRIQAKNSEQANLTPPILIFYETGNGTLTVIQTLGDGSTTIIDKSEHKFIILDFFEQGGDLQKYIVLFQVSGLPEEYDNLSSFNNVE